MAVPGASRVPIDDPIQPHTNVEFHQHIILWEMPLNRIHIQIKSNGEITIRLRGSDDVGSVSGAAANNRSIVVLKPFLTPGVSKKALGNL